MYIDLHAHLDYEGIIERIDEVIKNAEKANLKIILANGTHPEANRKVLELAKKYKIVKAALGSYPTFALENETGNKYRYNLDKELEFIKKSKDKIFALGEIGLDYKMTEDRKHQQANFKKIIELSKKIKKPMIIHSRKAELDVLDMLENTKAKFVLHCFSGRKHLVQRAIDNGYSFSIPTNVVNLIQFQVLIEKTPLSQLFCETDAPFLSPFKDKRNEPAFVVESYKKVAEIKKMDIEEVSRVIYNNWQRMFE